jgi:glycosyltransferase involved in cell wall biosynthesis
MGTDTMVSVVAVTQNDGPVLRAFVAEVSDVLRAHWVNYEIVLVDDGSVDETLLETAHLLARYPCLRLVRLSRRFGREAAVTAGLDTAIGDFVVVIRPQFDPPAEIPAMVRAVELGEHEVVLGTSRQESRRGLLSLAGRHAFFWVMRRVLPNAPPANATGFCVLSRTAVNAITKVKSRYRHLGFLSCAVGSAATPHEYRQIDRSRKARAQPLREAVDEGIALLVGNSFVPLRLVSYLGAFAGAVNLLYVGYVLLVNLFKNQVAEGWTTLSLQMSCMFFFVFLNLVIISEYIAHIMQESQDRPLYHVLEERSSTVRFAEPERKNVA